MPFPWKKGKRTRITQLVAGHLKSPKRGGSLVVQTGFPTSLIDLFVKNRDRLKKKKKNRYENSDPIPNQPSPSCESFPVTPRSSFSGAEFTNPKGSPSSQVGDGVVVRDLNKPSVVVGGDDIEGGGREVADANGVFMAVFKISLVVVLALGTKRFAVGITISAFLLIFLEFAGRHGCKLLKPCSSAQKRLNSLIQRLLRFFGIKQEKFVKEEEEIRVLEAPIEQERVVFHELSAPIEEIQAVQPNSVFVPPIKEIQCVKDEFEGEKRGGFEELDLKKEIAKKEEDFIGDVSHRRSRRSMLKSKIKKLVPKKFRNSKKKGQYLKSEEGSCVADDMLAMSETQELEECSDRLSWLSSGLGDLEDDDDDDDVISNSTEVSRREEGRETERNSGTERNLWYLILFLIVLVGLVGGRLMALVLTVSSCLMLKPAGALWRSEKKPLFRSPVKKSTYDFNCPCL